MEFEPKNNEQKQRRTKVKRFLLLFLFFLLIIGTVIVSFYLKEIQRPELQIYYHEDFEGVIDEWTLKDAEIINKTSDGKFVQLSRKNYVAPHIKLDYDITNSPQTSFVWNFKARIKQFTDDAVVLGTLEFSNGDVSVVVNQAGYIGLATNMFGEPVYTTSTFDKVSNKKWHDIKIYFNNKEDKLVVYLDNDRVLETDLNNETYPIHKIWMGATWVGGEGHYGVPIDISNDDIIIANEGLVPKPSFWDYLLKNY